MDFVGADLALRGERHIQIDMAVAGVEINVGREIRRELQRYTAISALEPPVSSHGRPRSRNGLKMTISRLELEFVKAPIGPDVAVAGAGVKFAIQVLETFRAIAAVQIHGALQIREFNLAVAGAKIHVSLARHLHNDVHAMAGPPLEVEVVTGIAHLDFDRVAGLMLFHPDTTFADFVMGDDHRSFNSVLVQGIVADVGIDGLDAQVGIGSYAVSLRPFLGAGGK